MSFDRPVAVYGRVSRCHDLCSYGLSISPKTAFCSFRHFFSTGPPFVFFLIYWRRHGRGLLSVRVNQGLWHICSFSFHKLPIWKCNGPSFFGKVHGGRGAGTPSPFLKAGKVFLQYWKTYPSRTSLWNCTGPGIGLRKHLGNLWRNG